MNGQLNLKYEDLYYYIHAYRMDLEEEKREKVVQ